MKIKIIQFLVFIIISLITIVLTLGSISMGEYKQALIIALVLGYIAMVYFFLIFTYSED